jgi:hypothetical protein
MPGVSESVVGPRYGYFSKGVKSYYICKGEDKAKARA